MKKRIFSMLLLCCMVLTLLPVPALAEGGSEGLPICICETACTAETMNADCPVCGAEGAAAESCGKYTAPADGETAQPTGKEQPGNDAPDAEKPEEPAVHSVEQGIAVQAAHTHCFCGGSVNAGDHTSHKDVTYTACTKSNYLRQIFYIEKVDVAYAYLENDITLDYHLSIQEGKTLYLCLNGHTLNLGEYNILVGSEGATLYLCDCSAQKTGTVSGGSTGCVSLYDASDHNATFNMYGGTLRDGKKSCGGGVDVDAGTMNMYGGTITENTATSDGGGIYVGTKSTLNLYGGTITKNTVSTNEGHHGGGVYVESNKWSGVGKISISGSPVITGNTRTYTPDSTTTTENVYLGYGFTNSGDLPIITLGTVTSGANIGISASKTVFSTASETDYSNYFFSDDTGYHVEYNADKKLELKSGSAHVHSGGTATCTQKAVCSICGKAYGELAEHKFTAEVAEKQYLKSAATCTAKAVYYKSCAVCGAKGTETFEFGEKAAHDFTAEVAEEQYLKSAASCTAKAVYYKSCAVCGAKGTETFEFGEKAAHDFTAEVAEEQYLKSAATCTAKAVYYKSCAVCGEKGTETFEFGKELGHDFTAEVAEEQYLKSAASCTAKAVYYKSCAVCGAKGTETFEFGEVLGHDFTAEVAEEQYLKSAATCTAKAVYYESGAVCGEKGTETFEFGEKAAHDFTAEVAEEQYLKSAATCTAKAEYYKSCAVCGEKGTETFEFGEKAAHDFTAEVAEKQYLKSAATCTAKAVYYKSCAVCGEKSTETFEFGEKDSNNHSGREEWTITATTHEKMWNCCSKVTVDKAKHSFGEWTVKKQPTFTEEGEREHTCTICDYQETESIPVIDCTLHFETNGGSDISDLYKPYNTTIDLAKYEPTRSGYRFTDWYTDEALTDKVTSIQLTGDMTIYAGWKVVVVNPFTDVCQSDWFYDDVQYVYENGLMKGTATDQFSPKMSTTRGMIVTILYRMENEPAVSDNCPFDDVKADAYYEKAITWAATNGIVLGYGHDKFGPEDNITREQMTTILYRYAKYKGIDVSVGEDTNILSYNDAFDVSDYAVLSMQWACGTGLIKGSSGNNLLPKDPATRAQVAAILHRFCENF